MKYPKKILHNIYWSFSIGEIETIESFVEKVEEYNKNITGKKLNVNWDQIVFNFSALELQYVKIINGEVEEPYELITSETSENFSLKELFYNVHKVGINLADDENCFF
ncbi:hypothetical protein [Mesonia sp. K4-1]|uniref:hypothetical protein n=1 Tax=Mesonia sp. K4-1 TaxID=2602760 RepID=UPI0011C96380|nr:hypothetical protein [Mesonia sp. K4-1]TXK74408.1 hypothetical protein FT986_11475 [Mesonia sp. K4-1]